MVEDTDMSRERMDADDDDDEDVGPMPMPAGADGHVMKKKRKGPSRVPYSSQCRPNDKTCSASTRKALLGAPSKRRPLLQEFHA